MSSIDKHLQEQVNHIADCLSYADKYTAMRREDLGEDFDENEHTGAYDWLSDVLDIKYIVTSDGTYSGSRVCVALGGPNIWVDFETMKVEGYWWIDRATASFTDDMGVEDVLIEMWETR